MKTLKQEHIAKTQKNGHKTIIAPELIKGKGIAAGIELVKDQLQGFKKYQYARVIIDVETGEKAYSTRYATFEDARIAHEINMGRKVA